VVAGDQSQPVDCLILGGGPGGYVAALRAAQCGRRVTLVERSRLGGVCLNSGCIPSKGLIELATAQQRQREMSVAGLPAAPGGVDLAAFQVWKGKTVDQLARGVATLLNAAGVSVVAGSGRFVARGRVGVEAEGEPISYFDCKDVVIATGTRPTPLDGIPFEGERVVSAADALSWSEVPPSLVIAGGGYIGVELAVAFARLGAAVCLVEAADRLLPDMDCDLSEAALSGARRAGVTVLLRGTVTGLDGTDAVIRVGEAERRVPASRIAVALGRTFCAEDIDLAVSGFRAPDGLLAVDSQLRLDHHVFALGDATAGPPLAHRATAQGRVLGEVLGGQRSEMDVLALPEVVVAEPEMASAGLTEEAARARGADVGVGRFPFSALGRAWIGQAERGWVKLVFDRSSGRLLGAQVAGPRAAEVIGEAVLGIELGATLEDLALIVHPHPAFGEGLGEAALAALGRPVHVIAAPARAASRRTSASS
jgi:dihydrolipoamide dehydrogenase